MCIFIEISYTLSIQHISGILCVVCETASALFSEIIPIIHIEYIVNVYIQQLDLA